MLSILAVMMLIATVSASAQSSNDVGIVLSSGISIPSAPDGFADERRSGFNIAVGVSIPWTDDLSFILTAEYHSFPVDGGAILNTVGFVAGDPAVHVDNGEGHAMTYGVDAKYLLISDRPLFAPYIIGGVGYFHLTSDDAEVIRVTPQSFNIATVRFGDASAACASIGAGIDVPGGVGGLFIEARYSAAMTSGGTTSFIPVRIGLRGSL
jgi:hypothetical protein